MGSPRRPSAEKREGHQLWKTNWSTERFVFRIPPILQSEQRIRFMWGTAELQYYLKASWERREALTLSPSPTMSLHTHRAGLLMARSSRGIWKWGRWQNPGRALACRTASMDVSACSNSSISATPSCLLPAQSRMRVVTAGLKHSTSCPQTCRTSFSPHHPHGQRSTAPADAGSCSELHSSRAQAFPTAPGERCGSKCEGHGGTHKYSLSSLL